MVVFCVVDLSLSFWISHLWMTPAQQDLQHVSNKSKTKKQKFVSRMMMKPDETRTAHSILITPAASMICDDFILVDSRSIYRPICQRTIQFGSACLR
jgi:hypothetical protein